MLCLRIEIGRSGCGPLKDNGAPVSDNHTAVELSGPDTGAHHLFVVYNGQNNFHENPGNYRDCDNATNQTGYRKHFNSSLCCLFLFLDDQFDWKPDECFFNFVGNAHSTVFEEHNG